MEHQYSGYLRSLLWAPDPGVTNSLADVLFTAEDLVKWTTRDFDSTKEWRHVPVQRRLMDGAVRVQGRFEDLRCMDSLDADDLRFWVPLGTLGWNDGRFPIDVSAYPVVEVTYRCGTPGARPVWVWQYPGGLHIERLPYSEDWATVAHPIQHFGFPKQVNAVVIRLYSPTRTTEAIEIKSVRFRARSDAEAKACRKRERECARQGAPRRYPVLDEFMPLGVHMDALTSRRHMATLGFSMDEYWDMVFEDLVLHHHNCIALANFQTFAPDEFRRLLARAEPHGIRFIGLAPRPDQGARNLEGLAQTHIKPNAGAPNLLAWNLNIDPSDCTLQEVMASKRLIEEADPNHPAAVVTDDPSAYSLLGRFFAASGISYYPSHCPWEVGDMVETHAPLSMGQQFWMWAPTFVYATEAPEWSSCAEMRLMVNLGFACGAKGWFSFTYHNDPIWAHGTCQRSLTGPFLAFSDLWAELGMRMGRYEALAPLLLRTQPEGAAQKWFVTRTVARENARRPAHVPPTVTHRLKGPDFDVFFVVSNDVREMASVNIHIPPRSLKGREIYDLSDFVQKRKWAPMNLERHLEMFPGQARVLLIAKPETCLDWRDVIAARLVEDDRTLLAFNMTLAREYHLDTAEVEAMTAGVGDAASFDALQPMDRARDVLFNLIQRSAAFCEARSKILDVFAAAKACDGALCRLLGRGKVEQARELGA
ncbi:MAG TPA: hypothetical protein HPP77_09715, partial [Candidatus Hydrogenedentes bacterium]|nr:hypothetical protein [Candidatus Hydrogenedentota bacterium]